MGNMCVSSCRCYMLCVDVCCASSYNSECGGDHLASTAVTPVGSVHKSRGDNVVRTFEEMMCVVWVGVTKGGIVVMDMCWQGSDE